MQRRKDAEIAFEEDESTSRSFFFQFYWKPMRSPAYKRRQERRQAARVAAEQAAEVKEEDANEFRKVEEDAVKPDSCNGSESIVTDQVMDQVEIIRKETGKFTCTKCSFESNWENGLDVHKKTAHVLEMQKDNSLNEKYENTSHYWKTDI